jgi:hypothetical protein
MNANTAQAPGTDVEARVAEATAIEVSSIEALRSAYEKALGDYAKAKDDEDAARVAKLSAAVWLARIAYRTATHEAIATKRYPTNITGAAKALGKPVATLRPYALAGEKLHAADRAGLLSVPDAEDMAIVDKSFEDGVREQQRQKRIADKEKKAALEAKARELEALKQANGTKAPAPTGDVSDVKAAADAVIEAGMADKAQAPAKAPEAPVQAPAGPSLQADTEATARELVRKIKALQKAGDWKAEGPRINAILAEVYPALKR